MTPANARCWLIAIVAWLASTLAAVACIGADVPEPIDCSQSQSFDGSRLERAKIVASPFNDGVRYQIEIDYYRHKYVTAGYGRPGYFVGDWVLCRFYIAEGYVKHVEIIRHDP